MLILKELVCSYVNRLFGLKNQSYITRYIEGIPPVEGTFYHYWMISSSKQLFKLFSGLMR
ncbi:uncharacterized protein METZ01_LOCUS357143, partial [marine metagenome]